MDVLKKEQLFLMSKCEFGKPSLVYLGHTVGGGEMKIEPSKVNVMMNWKMPKKVTRARSFLGVAKYWRNFIAKFSSITTHLHALTIVENVFQWGGKK